MSQLFWRLTLKGAVQEIAADVEGEGSDADGPEDEDGDERGAMLLMGSFNGNVSQVAPGKTPGRCMHCAPGSGLVPAQSVLRLSRSARAA